MIWAIPSRARPQVFVEAAFLELSVKEGRDMGVSMHSGVTAEGSDWVDPVESPWVAGALQGGAGIVGSTTAQGLRSVSPVSAAGLLGLVGAFQGISIPGIDDTTKAAMINWLVKEAQRIIKENFMMQIHFNMQN